MEKDKRNFFKRARDAAGLTQFQVAVAIGIQPSTVSGWERGLVPAINLVDKIAQVYDVKVEDVLAAMHGMARDRQAKLATA